MSSFFPFWVTFAFGLALHVGICILNFDFFVKPGLPKKWQSMAFAGAMASFSGTWSVGPWVWHHCFWPDLTGTATYVATMPWHGQIGWGMIHTPAVLVAIVWGVSKQVNSNWSTQTTCWRCCKLFVTLSLAAVVAVHLYCFSFSPMHLSSLFTAPSPIADLAALAKSFANF